MKFQIVSIFLLASLFLACSPEKKPNEQKPDSGLQVDPNQALADVSDQISNQPGNAALLHDRALLYIKGKRYQDALVDMNKAVSIDSTKSAYYLTLADLAFAANRTYNAKENLEKALQLEPENKDATMRLAELYLILRQHKESVELLTKVLAKDKSNTVAWLMRGFNFKENGDTNRAISDFRSAIEANPDYYDAYMQLGMIFQLRNNPISEGYFDNAIRIRPESEEALYGRGLWYQDHENFDKAIQDYTSILQFNPNYKNAHFNLGYIHHIYLKVYQEAIKHYGKAIQVDPNYAEAYYNRALCFEFLGDLQNAKSDFQSALKVRPDYPPAEAGLARVTK